MAILANIEKAESKMPQNSFISQLDWLYVWLASLTALWGGLVSYFRRIQSGLPHSWWSLFMHISTSGFAGLLCLLGCLSFEVPVYVAGICCGIAGSMGSEFIKILEEKFQKKVTAHDYP